MNKKQKTTLSDKMNAWLDTANECIDGVIELGERYPADYAEKAKHFDQMIDEIYEETEKVLAMETITLGQYDYYDMEAETYIIYIDEQNNSEIQTDVRIEDGGVTWKCYLVSTTYQPESNSYKCEYKCYGD